MSAIINFLKGIADGVKAAIDFLLSMIADIAYVVQLTAKFVAEIPQYLSFIPGPVVAMIVAMFAVVVIYKILGREG